MKQQALNEVMGLEVQGMEDPIALFTAAINNLTQAQLVYAYRFDKYLKEKEGYERELASKITEIDRKIDGRQNSLFKNSVHLDYIENKLIPEVAERYGVPQNRLCYTWVRDYRESIRNSHDMNMSCILDRLTRLYSLRGVENCRQEFEGETCAQIGKTRRQIRMEPQAVAVYFDDGCGVHSFLEALTLNSGYMEIAKNVILSMEEKYGIFDTDKEYATKLSSKLWAERRDVSNYSDRAYLSWVEDMVKHYEKLCRQPKDEVMTVISEGFGRFCKDRGISFTCDLRNNYTTDMHKILGNKELREFLSEFLAKSFISVW